MKSDKMKVFVLMTQWKDDDPVFSGAFSSFDKAVRYFVRTMYDDSELRGPELRSECANVALKMAGMTDDDDRTSFGDVRAWIEQEDLDEM